jgi:hypothetical protein
MENKEKGVGEIFGLGVRSLLWRDSSAENLTHTN